MKMSKTFQPYDFNDAKANLYHYGSPSPIPYNLAKVTTPVTLIYSKSDESADFTDVIHLNAVLSNVRRAYQVPSNDFKHVDFIYSRFVRKLINDQIIDILETDL